MVQQQAQVFGSCRDVSVRVTECGHFDFWTSSCFMKQSWTCCGLQNTKTVGLWDGGYPEVRVYCVWTGACLKYLTAQCFRPDCTPCVQCNTNVIYCPQESVNTEGLECTCNRTHKQKHTLMSFNTALMATLYYCLSGTLNVFLSGRHPLLI